MTDPLLARAQLAIEENRKVRQERLTLRAEHENVLTELHRNLLKNAFVRAEIVACRQGREAG